MVKALILAICILFSITHTHASATVQVIINSSMKLDSLTTTQLRRIYSMRQSVWPNGQPITVYALPRSHPTHQVFSKKTLKIFPYQLDRVWNKLVFSGTGKKPIIVDTQAQLLEAVSSTEGAIGYIDNMEIKDAVNVVNVHK